MRPHFFSNLVPITGCSFSAHLPPKEAKLSPSPQYPLCIPGVSKPGFASHGQNCRRTQEPCVHRHAFVYDLRTYGCRPTCRSALALSKAVKTVSSIPWIQGHSPRTLSWSRHLLSPACFKSIFREDPEIPRGPLDSWCRSLAEGIHGLMRGSPCSEKVGFKALGFKPRVLLEGWLVVLWSFPAGCQSPGCKRV